MQREQRERQQRIQRAEQEGQRQRQQAAAAASTAALQPGAGGSIQQPLLPGSGRHAAAAGGQRCCGRSCCKASTCAAAMLRLTCVSLRCKTKTSRRFDFYPRGFVSGRFRSFVCSETLTLADQDRLRTSQLESSIDHRNAATNRESLFVLASCRVVVVPCRAVPCRAVLYRVVSCHALPCRVVPCRNTTTYICSCIYAFVYIYIYIYICVCVYITYIIYIMRI
jgi:hypothetical protein